MNHFIITKPTSRAACVAAALLLAAAGTSAFAQAVGTYTGRTPRTRPSRSR